MNSVTFVAFFACLAIANAGVVVAPTSSKIIQGPSTRTTVVGPDGSSISSVSPGGSIVQEETAGVVAETASVVAAAPALAYAATPIAYSAHAATPIAYSAHAATPIAYSADATRTLTYAAGPLAYSAPLAYSSYSSPVISAYSAPLAYSSAVVAENQLDTLIAGPSGSIATGKTVHRPALVATPQVYAAGVHAYYL